MKDFFELRENKDKFVVKYAMSKKGPIRTMPFHLLVYAKKFLADKEKEGYKGIISKNGKPVKESVELEEAKVTISLPQATGQSIPQFEKMSKELLKKKHLGIEFEKAAAFTRVMFMNSSLHVQDKAMKGLLTLIKGIDDLTIKTTLIKILKDNGFKVKGGRVMREEVEPITENYRTLAMHGMGTESKGEARVGLELDYYDSTGSKRMGKITKMTKTGYVVKDEKDGKSHTFAFHDRAKAKELLAKHGKGKYNESTEHGKSVKESVDLDEAKLSAMGIHNKIADRNLLIKAIKTAEKMGGNMTGAVREIEKMQKGLSKHKAVQAALRQANESTE